MAFENNAASDGFPHWAPESLLNRLVLVKAEIDESEPPYVQGGKEYAEVLTTLTTHSDMKDIWGWFDKKNKKNAHFSSFNSLAISLSRCIYSARFLQHGWNALTKKELEDKKQKIANLLDGLIAEMTEYPVCKSIFSDLTHYEVDSIRMRFLRCAVAQRYGGMGSAKYVEELAAFEDCSFSMADPLPAPDLGVILGRISNRLKAVKVDSFQTGINREGSEVRYFIRLMAEVMVCYFGSRHYNMLARLAVIFYPHCDIDEKRVTDMFRSKGTKTPPQK